MELVIEVSHLYKAFDGQDRLTDVNFKIKKGECVALIGPNGAGKTTLFNCWELYICLHQPQYVGFPRICKKGDFQTRKSSFLLS